VLTCGAVALSALSCRSACSVMFSAKMLSAKVLQQSAYAQQECMNVDVVDN